LPVLALSTLFGLPAHALLVHAAVVLVPLAAVAFAAMGWRAAWRRSYSLPVALLGMAGAVFAFLAKQSGGPIKDSLRQSARSAGLNAGFGEHPEQGDTAFVFAMLFGLATVAFWGIDRYGERFNLPKWAPIAAYAGVFLIAALATLTMIAAGHSGAQLVWNDLGTFAPGG
jgi:hypothetical protein